MHTTTDFTAWTEHTHRAEQAERELARRLLVAERGTSVSRRPLSERLRDLTRLVRAPRGGADPAPVLGAPAVPTPAAATNVAPAVPVPTNTVPASAAHLAAGSAARRPAREHQSLAR